MWPWSSKKTGGQKCRSVCTPPTPISRSCPMSVNQTWNWSPTSAQHRHPQFNAKIHHTPLRYQHHSRNTLHNCWTENEEFNDVTAVVYRNISHWGCNTSCDANTGRQLSRHNYCQYVAGSDMQHNLVWAMSTNLSYVIIPLAGTYLRYVDVINLSLAATSCSVEPPQC